MMAKTKYNDSLLDDFEGVEDISDEEFERQFQETANQSNEVVVETDDNLENSTQPNEVPEVDNAPKEQNDLSIEELQSLLGEPATEKTEEVVETTENKGDLNVALHQSREKTSNFKSQNDLLKQEIELLKQQVEFSKVNNSIPNAEVVAEPVDDDILKDLEDSDMISKADLNKILQHQTQVQKKNSEEQLFTQNKTKALQLSTEFNNNHGKELGLLSYENIYKLVSTNKVLLSDGQRFDIENAINNGKNPAELLYNTVIDIVPSLKKKKMEEDIKRMIKERGSIRPVQQSTEKNPDDFVGMRSSSKNLNDHLDSLSDF